MNTSARHSTRSRDLPNRRARRMISRYPAQISLLLIIVGLVCFARWTAPGQAASIIIVNSTADGPVAIDGRCTLREAITAANTDALSGDCLAGTGADTITFLIPEATDTGCVGGVCTIKPTSQLPNISAPVIIDGYTQPGAQANTNATGASNAVLKIELSGQSAGGALGLTISAGNTTLRGLVINRFNSTAVRIDGATATGNIVTGNYIGTNAAGTAALPNNFGIDITAGAANNRIGTDGDGAGDAAERNVISGNTSGVFISTSGNIVAGNFIGTNAAGTAALANSGGVGIGFGATNNRIGTDANGTGDDAERNVISGNFTGILIQNAGTSGNFVAGNFIGTNAAGTAALSNTFGIDITTGAANNRIGTDGNGTGDAAERNVISGNGTGIRIQAAGTSGNVVAGNFIGTNAAGTAALANPLGVNILSGATNNRIGTDSNGTGDEAERNVISGGTSSGIRIEGAGTSGNVVAGNFIGTNAAGTAAVANNTGVNISSAATNNRIGTDGNGTGDGDERNVVSGNTIGILIQSTGTSGNVVAGNVIGTNAAGTAVVANQTGILVSSAATNNRIGTDGNGTGDEAERNVISGNSNAGIGIDGAGTSGNVVAGNFIGTNAAGTAAVANSFGISIQSSATNNRIGTDGNGTGDEAERNVISGNSTGINIQSAGTSGNVVAGNFIGTNVAGTAAVANLTGILIGSSVTNNRIGTDGNGTGDEAERNVISGNTSSAITIQSTGTSGNFVAGNFIGTNAAGTAAVANQTGVIISSAATNNRIGTDGNGTGDEAERNVISGNNTGIGIVFGAGTSVVAGNYIGTNAAGTAAVANQTGILVSSAATNNRIGTDGNGTGDEGERNVISGNSIGGIHIDGAGTSGNVVAGNYIGTNASGAAAVANSTGIFITISATNNRIGGTAVGAGNLIAFNTSDGVAVTTAGAGNTVSVNSIRSNGTATTHLGIDLGANGVTDNDAGDTDTGPNNLQNFPLINYVVTGSAAAINGVLDSPSGNYRIEFFANASCDASGAGEGQTFLGFINTSGANSPFTFNATLPAGQSVITSTATNISTGDTSEFSRCNVPTVTTVTSSANPSNAGQNVTFTATVTSAAFTPTGSVQFKDGGANIGAPITLNASGVATFSTSTLAPGTHTITAEYSGTANFSSSTGTLSGGQVVNNTPLISLSQSNYNVNETTGFVTITVNRTGDLSVPVTVDYATDDTGSSNVCSTLNSTMASARCDFSLTLGTLRFAANETQKTFVIPINQDSFTEGDEMFTVNLSNLTGSGAGLASPSNAIVTVSDSAAPAPNANDDPSAFVRQQYHDFLNREPDAAGLAFWTNEITSCGNDAECRSNKRINVSAAFFLSIEFQTTGNLVRAFYVAALDRPLTNNMPNFSEFERDTQAMQRGLIVGQGDWQQTLNDNRDAFMRDFVTRPEFVGLYPTSDTPTQYVDKLILHAAVALTSGERNAAIAEFGAATTAADAGARGRALFDITQNAAFQSREMNRSFVQMEYFGYLRRNPNDAPDGNFVGYDFWLNKLNAAGGNYISSEMVKAFLTSIEYRQRFGP